MTSACGHPNRPGVAFCETCGERLLIEATCGHLNRTGVSFCETCGQPTSPNATPGPPDAPRRSPKRIAVLAAVVGAVAMGSVAFVLGSRGEPTARDLVDRLPEPVELSSCGEIAETAIDFARAAAAVVADEPALLPEIASAGDGYGERSSDLGCSEESLAGSVAPPIRPDAEADPADLVEYVLRGGQADYPEDTPRSISTGGNG